MRPIIALFAIFTVTTPAQADMVYRPGLESLCFEADSIVLTQVGTAGRVIVTDVLHGDTSLRGRALDLPDLRGLDMTVGWAHSNGEIPPIAPDRAVLFLRGSGEDLRIYATGNQGSAGTYWATPDDRVYGYVQMMNPGDLSLVAGGADQAEVPATWADMSARVSTALAQRTLWERAQSLPSADKAAMLAHYTAAHSKPADYRMGTVPWRVLRPALAALGADAVQPLIQVLQTAPAGADLNFPVLALYDIGPAAKPAIPALHELKANPGGTHLGYIESAIGAILGE